MRLKSKFRNKERTYKTRFLIQVLFQDLIASHWNKRKDLRNLNKTRSQLERNLTTLSDKTKSVKILVTSRKFGPFSKFQSHRSIWSTRVNKAIWNISFYAPGSKFLIWTDRLEFLSGIKDDFPEEILVVKVKNSQRCTW